MDGWEGVGTKQGCWELLRAWSLPRLAAGSEICSQVYRELEDDNKDEDSDDRTATAAPETVQSPSDERESAVATKRAYSPEVLHAFKGDPSLEKFLVGTLATGYDFKQDGLVKKVPYQLVLTSGPLIPAISMQCVSFVVPNGVKQHIVSYYTLEDVLNGRLQPVSTISELRELGVSSFYMSRTYVFNFPPVVYMGQDGSLYYL